MNEQDIKLKSTPQDVFLHLLATITLYTSVFSLISLLFDYVNIKFPDALNPSYGVAGSIQWEMALLIIIFPVFVWTFRFLRLELMRIPEKVDLKIRRWLMYLTLFLSALLIIGDLVALLYNFLQGELSLRFALKILIVLMVAGITFALYLYDIRRRAERYGPSVRLVSWIVVCCVAAAAFAGFFFVGSPFKQRLIRFDTQKLNDIQSIQYQVVNYWQNKSKLPATLADLQDSISGYSAPRDPESGEAYEYRPTGSSTSLTAGNLTFELCGTFNFASVKENDILSQPRMYPKAAGSKENNWDHSAGRACFERTIDPDLYPPQKIPLPAGVK